MKDVWILNIKGIVIAFFGGILANILHLPLPWLLGALFATALWKINGRMLGCDNRLRKAGQWVIGTSLGLHFTPEIMQLIMQLYGGILWGVFFAFAFGIGGAFILYRFFKLDLATAWFSSMVGGASEMATMAETYKGRVDFVASAHTIRVMMIVTIIPFAFHYLGLQGNDTSHDHLTTNFSIVGLFILILSSGVLAFILKKFKCPVVWVISPLLITGLLTVQDIHLTGLPDVIKYGGQLLIGLSLGSKFSSGFFSKSPKFLLAIASYNIFGLGMTLMMAYIIQFYIPVNVPTLILSLSAGGIAEMTIIAETLKFGVAIVTVFHVIRMMSVVILAQPLFLIIKKILKIV